MRSEFSLNNNNNYVIISYDDTYMHATYCVCKSYIAEREPEYIELLLGNSGQVRCFCQQHNNSNYCEGPQPVQRTVSAACLYAIVRNGTAKPVSLETRFSGENRDRKKKTCSAEHEQDWQLAG